MSCIWMNDSVRNNAIVEELAMETQSPTPHTAMCETHPGDPTVRREAMLAWNVLAGFSSRFAVKLRTTELL